MPSGFWPRPALAGGDCRSRRARLDVGEPRNSPAFRRTLAIFWQRFHASTADANLLRTLAGAELQGRRYGTAIEYYKKALAAQPDDSTVLNVLGYTQAYAGDLDGAVKTLRESSVFAPRRRIRSIRWATSISTWDTFPRPRNSTGRSIPKIRLSQRSVTHQGCKPPI